MDRRELIEFFMEHYHTRGEIVYRLPLSVPIGEFWPEELARRREMSVSLPLRSADGGSYWYVPTRRFLSAGDALAAIAREGDGMPLPPSGQDSLVDEAYYSSAIEGAYTTRAQAHELIHSGKSPKTRDERMVVNNYMALRFALEHLDGPINEAAVLEIARLLTDGTLEEDARPGWRDAGVRVISGRQEVVYEAPPADRIGPMLSDLFAFLAQEDVHPVVKACAAHIYFVTIHPLFDGNGRTARALAYMILLKAGYDFFRQVPISGLLCEERAKYYKAVRACQDPANGGDFTYFMEYYADMLERSVESLRRKAGRMARAEELRRAASGMAAGERLYRGLVWLYERDIATVTAEKWKDKMKVSFETARKDLMYLAEHGYLTERSSGHKKYFDVPEK